MIANGQLAIGSLTHRTDDPRSAIGSGKVTGVAGAAYRDSIEITAMQGTVSSRFPLPPPNWDV